MAPNDILTLLRARPFTPFRLVTVDGTAYEIRHPELVVVALTTAVIGYPAPGLPGAAERYDIVSIRHVLRLEPLGNGPVVPSSGGDREEGNEQGAPA